MEQPQFLQLYEQQENKATNMDMTDCRFRHGLNAHCQIKVLQYLNLYDLLQLSKMDKYFKDLAMKWVIGTRLINLEFISPDGNIEMFEAFGKSFRRLRVKGSEHNFILENIIKYCSQNMLTELQIIVEGRSYNLEKMDIPIALFTNLQKLRLENNDFSELFLEHLEKIADNALNLKILQVRGNKMQGAWLRTKNMQNLRELWLYTTQNISINDLISFVRDRPNLKVFSFAGKEDITIIGETLSKYCSGLEKFCYEDLTANQIYNYVQADKTKRFDFLSTFPNLNSWTLTSSSAFQYLFMALGSNNIKEIIIGTDFPPYNKCSVKYSASVQTMKVQINANLMLGDTTTEHCQLRCNFIISLLSKLKTNIPNITIISRRQLVGFNRILEIIPPNCTLSLSNVSLKLPPVEIRKIVRILRNIQQDGKGDEQAAIKLIVNQYQWREFEIYKDIKSITSISIDINPILGLYRHI